MWQSNKRDFVQPTSRSVCLRHRKFFFRPSLTSLVVVSLWWFGRSSYGPSRWVLSPAKEEEPTVIPSALTLKNSFSFGKSSPKNQPFQLFVPFRHFSHFFSWSPSFVFKVSHPFFTFCSHGFFSPKGFVLFRSLLKDYSRFFSGACARGHSSGKIS